MLSLNLTQTAEYALRAMSCLALLPEGQRLASAELAERSGVPLAYLLKVMRILVSADTVDSLKGHGGGFKLAKPAEEICFSDILKAMGYQKPTSDCVFGWGKCNEFKPCPMHQAWTKLNTDFVRWAEKSSLAEIKNYSTQHGILTELHGDPRT